MASACATQRPRTVRTVYTPTQHVPPPSHYLLYFNETESYMISAKTSIKRIVEDTATVIIKKKQIEAKIVTKGIFGIFTSDSNPFASFIFFVEGTFGLCMAEQTRLTRASQSQSSPEEEDEEDPVEETEVEETENEQLDEFNMSTRRQNETSSLRGPVRPVSQAMRDNGYRRPLEDLSNHTRTQRSRSPVDRGTLINEDEEEFSERRNEFEIQETSGAAFARFYSALDMHTGIMARKIDQRFIDLSKKIDKWAKMNGTTNRELDAYQDGSQTQRPSEMNYENENLLDIAGTSYGDYARKLMKKLFTEEELKSRILPPARQHLKRPVLDEHKFKFLN
ncbi:unnamed protein product, partial [Didymodactylos carnosus]